jgi:hypothetical protein
VTLDVSHSAIHNPKSGIHNQKSKPPIGQLFGSPLWLNQVMHTIRVFVLRLLVDSERLHDLRGTLRSVPEGEVYPFADEQALLALLRQATSPASSESIQVPQDQKGK